MTNRSGCVTDYITPLFTIIHVRSIYYPSTVNYIINGYNFALLDDKQIINMTEKRRISHFRYQMYSKYNITNKF